MKKENRRWRCGNPDGEHVMPDGKTIIVTDGVITEIKDPEEANGDEEIEALKARIEELERKCGIENQCPYS